MKKIEIKKEDKKQEKKKLKKIDDFYGKKNSVKRDLVAKDGIVLKPLRREDVLKKDTISFSGDEDGSEDDEKIKTEEKKAVSRVKKEKIVKNSKKTLLNDVLPSKDDGYFDDKEKSLVSDDEKPDLVENDDAGDIDKTSVISEIEEEKTDSADSDEETRIAAMREEIRKKLKEKNEATQAVSVESDKPEEEVPEEKKSFFGLFSFGKSKKSESVDSQNIEIVQEPAKSSGVSGDAEKQLLVEEEKRAMQKKTAKDNLLVALLVFVIMCTLGATSFYFYIQYNKPGMVPVASLSGPEQAKKDAEEIKSLIGEIMELPDDEDPILATVTDVEKVNKQKFFAKAQNGDRVLIYTMNKKAVLFRPSTGKIIEVSQVSGFDYGSKQPASEENKENENNKEKENDISQQKEVKNEEEVEISVKVAVYNGSKIKGLAQKIGEMLTLIPGVAVKEKTNSQAEYDKTIVIDLSGEQEDMAQRIAEALQAEVGQMPDGEKKPNVDILVIGGSDFKLNEEATE